MAAVRVLHRSGGLFRARTLCALALLAACLGLAGPTQAQTRAQERDDKGFDWAASVLSAANDDPRSALRMARDAAVAIESDADRRFWAHLAAGRIHGLLEQPEDSVRHIEQAEATLRGWQGASATHHLGLRLHRLFLATLSEEPEILEPKLEALARDVSADGQPRLHCEITNLRVWVLTEIGKLDEAWRRADELERCADTLGDVELLASVHIQRGMMASAATAREGDPQVPRQHFHRALEALGSRPARYMRSIVEWELGKALNTREPATQKVHFERARSLSLDIGDSVGAAIAATDLGTARLLLGDASGALALALEARKVFVDNAARQRMVSTYMLSIAAMQQLKHKGLPAEIEDARRWEVPSSSPRMRAQLARLMGEAYASLQQYDRAYEDMARAHKLDAQGRSEASNLALPRLQAAYDAALRDAENARLRLRESNAQYEVSAARAEQDRLWLALSTLAMALLAGGVLLLRGLKQRRQLADLASRDELTGAPNRRAVLAIARTQWEHCRRLQMRLSIAVIDLDHFKKINDTWGHDVGDRVLKAFAAAALSALRSQDRIGRYGGEEWLLVAPGTSAAEMDAIFKRIRTTFSATAIEGLVMPHRISFSMGSASDSADHSGPDTLITQADQRLYRAKASGRDRLVATD